MTTQARLHESLSQAGLLPPPRRLPYLRALMEHRGKYERSLLVADIGDADWASCLSAVSTSAPERALASALGHGSLLAEFAIAPVRRHFAETERIASLGARANLIVTAYDNLLDQGIAAGQILNDDLSPTAQMPWMGRIVESYFRLLGTYRNPVLGKVIRRMYIAEKATAAGVRDVIVWRRKSALPFVVLGLGGCSLAHRAWLYRTGLLMGWIDDAVDAERDARHGRSNRFDGEARIGHIVRLGRRVVQWWNRHARRRECRETFLYCLSTWTAPRTK